MYLLWLEIAMLVLVLFTVGVMCFFLVLDDPGIMNWFRTNRAAAETWTKQLIVRYKHQPRHTPQFIVIEIERQREWVRQSWAFSAT